MSKNRIIKRFVSVGDRLVHYRTAGEGPPALLLHDSVKSSKYLAPLINKLSPHFKVIALDTPGNGNSDPLPGQQEIPDFANAVKETMDALGLDKVCVYGRHTSAKVVLELVGRWPERFHVALMDGLSLPEKPYSAEFLASYLPPLKVDDRGAYLAQAWTHIQDMTRWFPWFTTKAATRMSVPIRAGSGGHDFALDFLMAGPNYASAYGAAMRYQGWDRLNALSSDTPAVFMAAEDDVLSPFLDKIPDNRARERVAPGSEPILQRVEDIFLRRTDKVPFVEVAQQPRRRQYLDFPEGQIHVRDLGTAEGPVTLFLHETPGGTSSVAPFLGKLSEHGRVLAPDLPGCAESDPLEIPDAYAYAETLARIVEAYGLTSVNVLATTTSTPIALAFAERYPDLVSALLLDGYIAPDQEMATQFCPPIEFDLSGSHLHKLWHQLRNQSVQWPWYAHTVDSIRWVDAELGGMRMHHRLLDTLKQFDNYGDATKAAFQFDSAGAMQRISCPVLALTVERDPAYAAQPTDIKQLAQEPRAIGIDARSAQAANFFNQKAGIDAH